MSESRGHKNGSCFAGNHDQGSQESLLSQLNQFHVRLLQKCFTRVLNFWASQCDRMICACQKAPTWFSFKLRPFLDTQTMRKGPEYVCKCIYMPFNLGRKCKGQYYRKSDFDVSYVDSGWWNFQPVINIAFWMLLNSLLTYLFLVTVSKMPLK